MNFETHYAHATHRVCVDVAQVWSGRDAPREVDAPILAAIPDVARWLTSLTFDDRLDLLGRVETQALFGEPVVVVSERDGWCEVRLPLQPTPKDERGYPGWVRAEHVAGRSVPGGRVEVVTERFAGVFHPESAAPVGALSGGSLVEVISEQTDHFVFVGPLGECRVAASSLSPRVAAPVASAAQFLGLPYLWSGSSGWGVDCSGLVHLCNRMVGVVVPRDSVDQFAAAVPDTVYFRHDQGTGRIHHVAFDLGVRQGSHDMLHAPKTGRVVEFLPISTPPYGQEAVWPNQAPV